MIDTNTFKKSSLLTKALLTDANLGETETISSVENENEELSMNLSKIILLSTQMKNEISVLENQNKSLKKN